MKEPPRPKEVGEAQALYLRNNPACAISGTTDATQAHHMVPYEYLDLIDRVWLASDQRIFIGLSETEKNKPEVNWHLMVGHNGSFLLANLHVLEDVAYYKTKGYTTTEQVKADPRFLARKVSSMPPVHLMSTQNIADLTAYVDATWPKIA